ncbi:MAG: pyruvate kinase [Candidatus Omnitrophota bacterium]
MEDLPRHTKIVATLGPASRSPEILRQMILAGMSVARINFSHGDHEEHRRAIADLRTAASELDRPVTLLQDLQGPKIRVGRLPGDQCALQSGKTVTLVPEAEYRDGPGTIPVDYLHAAADAKPGMTVLLADGAFELTIEKVSLPALHCRVVEGGILKSRKGVNFPQVSLQLPALTEKDKQDIEFGLTQKVDWLSLSFVRSARDIRSLKEFLASKGARKPILAKIEKPQAIEHLEEILDEVQGVMVARGDLGVEMSPEKVPMLQKRIIELCNRRGLPVITATQMLESMIAQPRPTRAEASDVANAIIDGTDAVMLSGESAVGAFPVRAVEMMARIATDVEAKIEFRNYPPAGTTETHALSQAVNVLEKAVRPRCIVVFTASGHTARFVAAERSRAPVIALTPSPDVYHALNLFWGIRPLLVSETSDTFEGLTRLMEKTLIARGLASAGDRVLMVGGIPAQRAGGTNFIKIHMLGS